MGLSAARTILIIDDEKPFFDAQEGVSQHAHVEYLAAADLNKGQTAKNANHHIACHFLVSSFYSCFFWHAGILLIQEP